MLMLPLLIIFHVTSAHGFCVGNRIRHNVEVNIEKGGFNADLSPGEYQCCHWSKCGGKRDMILLVSILIFHPEGEVKQLIEFHAGGCLEINEDKTNWNWPPTCKISEVIQSIAYKINPDVDGKCTLEEQDHEPYVQKKRSRWIHFLATGDPQYWMSPNKNDPQGRMLIKDVSDRTIATMKQMLAKFGDGRGYIVAGDLVQWADYGFENLEAYLDAFGGQLRYVFDGLGNHDIDKKEGWTHSRLAIIKVLRERNRVTATFMRPTLDRPSTTLPDYSWNWDDVHFVQLNDYPALQTGGLSWLRFDLGLNVGKSGNPVVLIHHYGFDGFSRGWWSDEDRKRYWNVIKGYNVIAILTGHLHTPWELLQYWEGDDYLNGTKIPFFITGGALHDRGYFLEILMTDSKMIVARRYGDNGAKVDWHGKNPAVLDLKPVKSSFLCAECSEKMNSEDLKFENIPKNDSILTVYPYPVIDELHVDVLPNNKQMIEKLEILDENGDSYEVAGANVIKAASKVNFSISQLPKEKPFLLRIKMTGGAVEQRRFWREEARKGYNP